MTTKSTAVAKLYRRAARYGQPACRRCPDATPANPCRHVIRKAAEGLRQP